MTLGPGDLVLCSGTLPRSTPFHERVAAAYGGGFTGLSLWARDYAGARVEGLSDADMVAMLDDHGLAVAELDPVWSWLPGSNIEIPVEADTEAVLRYTESDLYRIADALGARSINAVDVFGGAWDIDGAVDAFAALCDRAAEHGLLVHLEFLPWSKIPDLESAVEIVRLADRDNGGIAVDSWHLVRSGSSLDRLAMLPGDRIFAIQLSDGPAAPEPNLLDATLHQRRLPGEGDFNLLCLLDALTETGTEAPLGVEVFSDALHAIGPLEAARLAGDATREVIAQRATRA
jgi:sugar phosphate isomerase/epimerase